MFLNKMDHEEQLVEHVQQSNFPLFIDLIEQRKFNVNVPISGNAKDYLIHIAAYHNKTPDIIKVLLTHGAEINHVNGNKVNAVTYSVIRGNKDVTMFLLSLGNLYLNNKDCDNGTLLHHCLRYTRYEMFEHIIKTFKDVDIEVKHKVEGTLLEYACFLGKIDIVAMLIKRGADINVRDYEGVPLIIKCIKEKKDAIAKLLIEKKCIIDCFCTNNNDCLHYAVMNKNADLVALILRNGGNVDARCSNMNTGLHLAIESGSKDIINILLKYRAKKDIVNIYGKTARDIAITMNYKL